MKLELVKLKLVEDMIGSSFRSVKLAEVRWGNKSQNWRLASETKKPVWPGPRLDTDAFKDDVYPF